MPLDIEKQKERFSSFIEQKATVLEEFSQSLGFTDPHEINIDPVSFLIPLDRWLADKEISQEAKSWLVARLGYYIGDIFVVKYGGTWQVCENSESPFYGHYTVNDFENNPIASFSPIEAAIELIIQPKGRSLLETVETIESHIVDTTNTTT